MVSGGIQVNLKVEHCLGEVEVTIKGPKNSPELLRILSLLQTDIQRFWVLDEQHVAIAISPKSIVWAEMVDNKVFVYTQQGMYETSMSLAELENKWEQLGLFRCAKSCVINLNAITSLRSCPQGRIEAIVSTGEKVIVSRRYAAILRERIQ